MDNITGGRALKRLLIGAHLAIDVFSKPTGVGEVEDDSVPWCPTEQGSRGSVRKPEFGRVDTV